MNTRLQVEHPVTEAITGRDLVWDQLRVAAGEPLGYSQEDIGLWGHAVECRIYAEDPRRFLPSPGLITRLEWPRGSSIRVDAAVGEGSEVSSHYDPMIAKLTVWGRDRAAAIAAMKDALSQTVILGIETNIPFHLRVLDDPDFKSGAFSTRYIEEHPALTEVHEISDEESRALAAAAALAAASPQRAGAPAAGDRSNAVALSEWQRSVRWRG
jgi:acetyl/propionyl-CoA carboxylase alpha subunit